ncbi:type II toxin-antitoxin system YoeB family toxin (plasmid) [Rhizobium sp. SSM4.3]|uniref:Type II toxin-antitoxin system YoeB family toxin n=1 Tax=Peteryoungia algae TaxID=2919917 RepID=A0ABT0CZB7_9HYPH|nr:type II toxin-antitoxin system YoeB family toxin [Rhizobium sp. SSM4.3]MCJ8238488.1 type II toxin-antitoxin system YoeB family toxin [Rhizobium sp. SSM4.3]
MTNWPVIDHNVVKGPWSCRITQEHRNVYAVVGAGEDQTLVVMQFCSHF